VIDANREKIERCIKHLLAASLWSDLRECLADGGECRVVDSRSAFTLDGVTVYAAPDLVYRHASTSLSPVIVDWKTGKLDGVADQVAIYALLIRDQLEWVSDNGQYACRIVGLDEGREDTFQLTPDDLADTERRIRVSVARMRTLLADPLRNIAHAWDHYPLSWGKRRCGYCPFREICQQRIKDEIRSRDAEAA
jgi:hypothetical protein